MADLKSSVLRVDKGIQLPIERGFVIRSRRSFAVSNKYFHYCEENSLPFVAVELKRLYAYVSFDAISIDKQWRAMPKEIKQRFSNGIQDLYEDLHKKERIKKGSLVSLGPFYVGLTVRAEYAMDVAEKIVRIWKESGSSQVKEGF